MKEKYFKVKGKYKDSIVLVKNGNFWNAFYGDVVIVHYITGYKINNYKVGFPSKVLSKINSLSVSYILVYELEHIKCYEYESNSYTFYFERLMDIYKLEKKMEKCIIKLLQ